MNDAVKELIIKIADDALIFGHRNSEWTGLGPTLEEDIAFSSMAQDKIGHAWNLYTLLHEKYGLPNPDHFGFLRNEKEYKCCRFVEVYTQDYAFALVRQFLYDHADFLRYQMLLQSSKIELKQFAQKVLGEMKYHILHADTWINHLAQGNEDSKTRMQAAMDKAFPLAYGIFEPGPYEQELMESGIFTGEKTLQDKWLNTIMPIIDNAGLRVPEVKDISVGYGGRNCHHTTDFNSLLKEMSEVLITGPDMEW
jgi:ring-1,2-phenylacetyl-CoA epoxidase subunit PaaC